MKNALYTLAVLIVSGIVLAFLTPLFSKDKPNIRFVLGPSVSFETLNDGSTINAQQLDIYNIGDIEANNILTSLKGNIISVDVKKDVDSDKVNVYKERFDITNISYSSLLPARLIRISIKTKSVGIYSSDIYISHSQGKGKEGLEVGYGYVLGQLAYFATIIYIVFIFAWIGFGVRSSYVDHLEYQSKHEGIYLLKKKRPIVVSSEKWSKMRFEAIDILTKVPNYLLSNIEDTFCYKILTNDKPIYLSEGEWDVMLRRSENTLIESYEKISYMWMHSGQTIVNLLNISKPKNLTDSTWEKIKTNLSKSYIYWKAKNTRILSEKYILSEINSAIPTGLDRNCWDEYISFLKNLYFQDICTSIYRSDNPMKIIEEVDKNALPDDTFEDIKDKAYKIMIRKYVIRDTRDADTFIRLEKPVWMKKEDHDMLSVTANKLVKLDSMIEYNKKLSDELNDGAKNIAGKRDLLDKKLEFINHLLNDDPSIVDRIEDNFELFASGNIENLKKIASYIKKTGGQKE